MDERIERPPSPSRREISDSDGPVAVDSFFPFVFKTRISIALLLLLLLLPQHFLVRHILKNKGFSQFR